MHRAAALVIAAAIFSAHGAWAVGSSWNKIRYMGGTIQAKVNPYDYNTTLTVSPDSIVLAFSPRPTVRIKPAQVTSISYGQEAQRRVAAVVALSTPGNPPALFGLLRTKDHFLGIVYQTNDGKSGAVLLEAHRNFYLDILEALKIVTGKPIEISK
ncbi:MAG: hypothetical protein LAP85_26365 [Acidobacteriia bacterium]|nr:hypothetical protein [Terriglobia bacterium]